MITGMYVDPTTGALHSHQYTVQSFENEVEHTLDFADRADLPHLGLYEPARNVRILLRMSMCALTC